MSGYMMRPSFNRYSADRSGVLTFGPIQANWGRGGGAMPKGLRVYLTWPGRTRGFRVG